MSDGCKVYREACPEHGFFHGAEAEELREGIERLRDDISNTAAGHVEDLIEEVRSDLQALLDRVDARDSLAYREERRAPKKRRSAKATEVGK